MHPIPKTPSLDGITTPFEELISMLIRTALVTGPGTKPR